MEENVAKATVAIQAMQATQALVAAMVVEEERDVKVGMAK